MSDDKETRGARGDRAGQAEPVTEREKERSLEDQEFLPVIVKRTDEARRHPDDILQTAIEEGYEQLNRRPFSLFLSAVAAGLILGFVAMAVAVVSTAPDRDTSRSAFIWSESICSPW